MILLVPASASLGSLPLDEALTRHSLLLLHGYL